jgi:SAM-dependent methyltransferase
MSLLHYDAQATQRLLAVYATPDVVAQRAQFLQALALDRGERVLDVGCGPGLLAQAMAGAVGAGGAVCGVDVSEPLLAYARQHASDHASAHPGSAAAIDYRHADATALPLPDATFDVVVSTQVLEYVAEVDVALAEIFRVLRPGGRVAILDTDWDSIVWHAPDAQQMHRVLAAWEAHAADCRLPRTLAPRLRRAGFAVGARQVIALFNPEYDPDTYSNRIIDLVQAFVAGRDGIDAAAAAEWADALRDAGRRGEWFFSLNRYLFHAQRPLPGTAAPNGRGGRTGHAV